LGGFLKMKSTGIVRKVDELGRVVLPIELRRILNIKEKYEPADIFTGAMDDLIDYKGKKVAKSSIIEMAALAGLQVIE